MQINDKFVWGFPAKKKNSALFGDFMTSGQTKPFIARLTLGDENELWLLATY